MIGYIYKTTNLVNNKIYVGQHKVKDDQLDPNYFGSGKLILEALQKYGKENFTCEIITWCETEKELEDKEIYYIQFFKSTVRDGNYHMSDGGFVPRLSGELNGNYNKHRPHTEEEKKHLSEVTKNHKPTFTKHHSEETKKKIGYRTRINNLNRDPEIYKKVSNTAKGNKMMNKAGKCIRVHPEDFDQYLSEGWKFGGLSRVGKYKNRKYLNRKKCASTKNKIGINNTIINKFVSKDQLSIYLNDGWTLGLKKRVNQ